MLARSVFRVSPVTSNLRPRLFHTIPPLAAGRSYDAFRGEQNVPFKKIRGQLFNTLAKKQKAEADENERREHRSETVAFMPPVASDEVVTITTTKVKVLEHIRTLPVPIKLHQHHQPPPAMVSKATPGGVALGHGVRKTAKADVSIRPGTGNITINGKHWMDHFKSVYSRGIALEPIIATEYCNQLDVTITTRGGGYSGQAQAVRHALAHAFINLDPEYRLLMRTTGMSRKDLRVKERKHTGLRKARRPQQWVKR